MQSHQVYISPGLVRMVHASQTSTFRTRLENCLLALAQQTERVCVGQLPATVLENMERHRRWLSISDAGLDDAEKQLALDMLNSDWRKPFRQRGFQKLVHYCPPGCCQTERDCQRRMHGALHALFGRLYETPLLYRSQTAVS